MFQLKMKLDSFTKLFGNLTILYRWGQQPGYASWSFPLQSRPSLNLHGEYDFTQDIEEQDMLFDMDNILALKVT